MILYLYIVGVLGNAYWYINEYDSLKNMPTASIIWMILYSLLWPISILMLFGLDLITLIREAWQQKKTRK